MLDLSKKYKRLILVFLVFLCFFLIYGLINSFHKSIRFDADPNLYYQEAESIYYGRWMEHFGVKTNYMTCLYPLFLSPFFAISNAFIRVHVMSLFNSFLVASCVFPLYLIFRRFLSDIKHCFVLLVISMILPFTVSCMEFGMPEVLYYPLFFWLFYLLLINFDKQNYLLSFGAGAFTFIIFLCKYIIAAIVVAVALFPFVLYLVNKIYKKNTSFKNIFSKKMVINLAIYCFTFLSFVLIAKFAIFKIYSPLVIYNKITSWSKFGYAIYSCIHLLSAMIINALVIPIVIIIANLDVMDNKYKKLSILLLLYYIMTAGVITCIIYVKEDFGSIEPRNLCRYYHQAVPLLLLFVPMILENKKIFLTKPRKEKMKMTLIISLILLCIIFRGVGTDTTSYGFYFCGQFEYALEKMSIVRLQKYFLIFIYMALVSLFIYALFALITSDTKTHNKKMRFLMLTLLTATTCASSTVIGFYNYRKSSMQANDKEINAILNLNNFIASNNDSKFLVLATNVKRWATYSTYNLNGNIYSERFDKFKQDIDKIHKPSVVIDKFQFKTPRYNYLYPKTASIDYIIIDSSIKFDTFKFINVENVEVECYGYWNVFLNLDNSLFNFELH